MAQNFPTPALRTGLVLGTEHRMVLQPRMLQSVEVLQLGALDLSRYLEEKALSNEALELDSALNMGPGLGPESMPGPGRAGGQEATDTHWRLLNSQPDRGRGLQGFLEDQLAVLDLDPAKSAWVQFLASCLNGNGYLALADEDLLREASESGLGGGRLALGQAIASLQSLEPAGIGGRDQEEALLLQLEPRELDYPLLCQLIEHHLGDLARNKWPKVARKLGISGERLNSLLKRLGELNPRPAAAWVGDSAPVVHPDLSLEVDGDGGFELSLDRGLWPTVRIDPQVEQLAQDGDLAREVRSHLRGKIREARWLMEAVGQRQTTLLRVASAIFQSQPEFLRRGPSQMLPLSMQRVAEELTLAVSTVSRAVAGKYVHTPFGVLPLREFFQSAAGSTSKVGLGDMVRSLVAEEDPGKPLSDESLVEALAARGQKVARRTVAKYRRELGIRSSYQRLRHV